MFRLEKEMTPIVAKWLLDNGYMVRKEMITGHGYVDLVAFDRISEINKIYAIELKRYHYKLVLKQAKLNKCFADESYIAMPENYAKRAAKRKDLDGIGVISVNYDTCYILVKADPVYPHRTNWDYYKNKSPLLFYENSPSIEKWAWHTYHETIANRFIKYGNNLPKELHA